MSTRLASAQWADPAFVEETYLYRDETVWLGRSASEKQIPLGYTDDRHVCLVSGTRGGKGATSIINNLCLWPGSVVVIDPKGENATVTAPRRGTGSDLSEGLSQQVCVLDPFRTAHVQEVYRSRFNPLDTLDPDDAKSIDGATLIADALVIIHEDGKDPFWDESARAMVRGLLLHVLTAPEYEGRRNLVTLRKLITRGDGEAVEALRQLGEEEIASGQQLLWAGVKKNPAFDGLIAGVGDRFGSLLSQDPKVFYGVLQVADLNTEFIDSPGMQETLEDSDFQISELKTSREGLSLYLCLPSRCMNTHYRWLRMMISLIVMEMEAVKGQPATGYPLLMLLDEFAGLKRMTVIENAVAQLAGFGVKMFFVLQSLEQLKAQYRDNWETFLANSGVKLFFNLEDHFSRDYVSKLIGDTEIIREVRSEGDNISESESASESRSQSRSESIGDSSSRGHSVSEGTNSSVSESESHGSNRSTSSGHSISSSCSWFPDTFLKMTGSSSLSQTSSNSTSEGTSKSWSRSNSRGTSHGTSDSMTTGRSRTAGTSESETSGTTHGTSRGRTSGTSETIHRRPLISPDEIGQVFARIDDRDRAAYPGLGLALIAGQAPVAFRRVNYYEDPQFIGYFQPHPDHEFLAPRKHPISAKGLEPYKSYFQGFLRWTPAASRGAVVQAGDIMAHAQGTFPSERIPVRAPRTGRLTSTPVGRDLKTMLFPAAIHKAALAGIQMFGADMTVFEGDFEILYYETGAPALDPFEDLAAYCREMDLARAQQQRNEIQTKAREKKAELQAAERSKTQRRLQIRDRRKKWLWRSGVLGLLLAVDIIITAITHSVTGILIALAALGILGFCGWKIRQTVIDERENQDPPEKSLSSLTTSVLRMPSKEELEMLKKYGLDDLSKYLPKAK